MSRDGARDRMLARRTAELAAVGDLVESRTPAGRWTVSGDARRRVETGAGTMELRPDGVRPVDGGAAVLVRAHSPLTVGFARSSGSYLWYGANVVAFAHLATATNGVITYELLPETMVLGRPQPLLAEQPWTAPLRATSPWTHRRTWVDGLSARYELVDREQRVLVSEDRGYRRASSPGGGLLVAEWTISLHQNLLPDIWLLGILQSTTSAGRAEL
jgi:hypothetical protein